MASCVRNICAKNYRNLIIRFQDTVENVGDVFWGTQCSTVRKGKFSATVWKYLQNTPDPKGHQAVSSRQWVLPYRHCVMGLSWQQQQDTSTDKWWSTETNGKTLTLVSISCQRWLNAVNSNSTVSACLLLRLISSTAASRSSSTWDIRSLRSDTSFCTHRYIHKKFQKFKECLQFLTVTHLRIMVHQITYKTTLATQHRWTYAILTPARQAGTQFTYTGGMKGWVDLGGLLYRVAQKSKLLHFVHTFAKYWSIFTIFSPIDSIRNLPFSGMHTTLVTLLHYLVKHKYQKTSNMYIWAESIMVIFKVFK